MVENEATERRIQRLIRERDGRFGENAQRYAETEQLVRLNHRSLRQVEATFRVGGASSTRNFKDEWTEWCAHAPSGGVSSAEATMPRAIEPVLPNRLRAAPRERPFHVVLVEPEIPPNTGNIARLCAATACPLHLVGRLGFSIDDHAVRRAGLDYWPLVKVHTHTDLETAEQFVRGVEAPTEPRVWLFSGKATKSYLDVAFVPGDVFVFGKESVGLDESLLAARGPSVLGIPTLGAVRSLNLANCVAIALYEALRQIGALAVVNESGASEPGA
jgi:tRNA (cytidine/uridine-2'-O-)-methyltransferase